MFSKNDEILVLSSYPPRECGIATYSQDLLKAINEKFGNSFSIRVCALENNEFGNVYPEEVKYILHTNDHDEYIKVAKQINADSDVKLIFLQHEFGLFESREGKSLLCFLNELNKPFLVAFHTVLPNPGPKQKHLVNSIAHVAKGVVVMTKHSMEILCTDYDILPEKITVIYHGTHLIADIDKNFIKAKYNIKGRIILSTFGLLSSGKCIETALNALPAIVKKFPKTLYCIIGRTHPGVVKNEGEQYRDFLTNKIFELGLEKNVRFINKYLSLEELLEILQITDIYLFTSKDPNQTVSGTLSYAMGCSCAVIATPIPHAKEMLKDNAGIIVDFKNSEQLSQSAIDLLSDSEKRQQISLNAMHKINSTCWQNSAVAHAELFVENSNGELALSYSIPEISLDHIKRLTSNVGIIQFAKIWNSDLGSGYTLDDNARALIASIKYYEMYKDNSVLPLMNTYLNFLEFIQMADGRFINYVDESGEYSIKNQDVNLEDSTGRAIWALGEFIAHSKPFYFENTLKAEMILKKVLSHVKELKSPRAMAFAIKGLHHYNRVKKSREIDQMIIRLADNLVSKYRGISCGKWNWFEDYLTYANSVLPESLLYAYLSTGNELFKTIARSSFDFLLSQIFKDNKIKVVSNNGWHLKNKIPNNFGEQPIDVTYTILSLDLFFQEFGEKRYLQNIETAFSWFNGNNHLQRIIYNPVTGGCQDGLEKDCVNLNQGAESTICYLLARLVMEKYKTKAYSYAEQIPPINRSQSVNIVHLF